MAWYYQVTPHDTHDWDAAQTPVLIDGEFNGRPRKLLAQASRNGHYFLLDRATGEHLLTSKHIDSLNWTKGDQREGAAGPRSREGRERAGHAGVARHDRRDQLAAAELQPGHRPPVFRHAPDVQRHVPHRHRRAAAGMGRRRTQRRQRRQRAEGDRLQDRQGEMVASLRHGTGRDAGRARSDCSAPPAACCSATTAAATSSPTTRRPASRSGTRVSAPTRATVRRPSCSTAVSTSSSAPATRCTRSRCNSRWCMHLRVGADEDHRPARDRGRHAMARAGFSRADHRLTDRRIGECGWSTRPRRWLRASTNWRRDT